MADHDVSREDRQLPASERRLQKAAADGRVARSRDATHALLIAAALGCLALLGPALAAAVTELVRDGLRFSVPQVFETAKMPERLVQLGTTGLGAVLPTLGLLAAAAMTASLIPGGLVWSGTPVSFDFSRVNPQQGIQRIFSRHALIDTLKLLAITIALGLAAYQFTGGSVEKFVGLSSRPLLPALQLSFENLQSGITMLLGVLLLVALFDVPLQWFRHRAELRMTYQEVREETRESEGDPQMRGRLRARQREIGKMRMLSAIPSADVVITNPTHYAVAIRYDEARMGVPRVVAKGADLMALRMRELARECGVPLLEAPPLARALYANVEVDREIPAALYAAVAQVLAYVYQLRHFVPGRDKMPEAPPDLDVPPDLDPLEPSA